MYKDKDRQRQFHREWMRKRRQAWLDANGPCKICGSDDRLQVDHIDPTTKITHRVWSWRKDRRESELVKCQVLCFECHEKKTLEERPKTSHGTDQMYDRYRCRCDICRAYKSRKNALRVRKKANGTKH